MCMYTYICTWSRRPELEAWVKHDKACIWEVCTDVSIAKVIQRNSLCLAPCNINFTIVVFLLHSALPLLRFHGVRKHWLRSAGPLESTSLHLFFCSTLSSSLVLCLCFPDLVKCTLMASHKTVRAPLQNWGSVHSQAWWLFAFLLVMNFCNLHSYLQWIYSWWMPAFLSVMMLVFLGIMNAFMYP